MHREVTMPGLIGLVGVIVLIFAGPFVASSALVGTVLVLTWWVLHPGRIRIQIEGDQKETQS